MFKKFKSFLADDAIFTALLLILVGVISFGLGRQSVVKQEPTTQSNQSAGVVFTESPFKAISDIQDPEPPAGAINTKTKTKSMPVIGNNSAKVVASRSGKKYHLLDCSGAKRIKEENKIYFNSIQEAEAAGYTPAANCPGLK